jgi:hypothetical protein
LIRNQQSLGNCVAVFQAFIKSAIVHQRFPLLAAEAKAETF